MASNQGVDLKVGWDRDRMTPSLSPSSAWATADVQGVRSVLIPAQDAANFSQTHGDVKPW